MQNHEQNELPVNNETNAMPMDSQSAVTLAADPQAPAHVLKLARESKRMSLGDAAYALKVSPRVIEALESSAWATLPGRTFTVGMLRAYGRILEVSVDSVIETVPGAETIARKASQSTASQPKAARSQRDGDVKRQTNRMSKLGLLLIVLAILLAYVVPASSWHALVEEANTLYQRFTSSTETSTSEANIPVVPSVSTEQLAGNSNSAEQQAQTGTGTLELRFSAPAWVEVRDYTGRIIYSQLNAAGSTQFITGAAPLDVMVGNAKQVQARWRDEPVKLDKLSSDDVARQILR